MSKHNSTPLRHAATSTPNPATTDNQTDSEARWQELMVYNYLLFEAIDAMEQERATSIDTPLNQHWRQFLYLLRQRKPELSVCLDNLRDGFWSEQGGVQ